MLLRPFGMQDLDYTGIITFSAPTWIIWTPGRLMLMIMPSVLFIFGMQDLGNMKFEVKMKTAKDIMTSSVITVNPDTTIKEFVQLLGENRINGAPVIDADSRLVGIVTEADIVDQCKKLHIPSFFNFLDGIIFLEDPSILEKEIKKMAGTTVQDIFTKDVKTIIPDTPVQDIATIMAEDHIQTLPVMDGDRLAGIVGRWDVVKAMV